MGSDIVPHFLREFAVFVLAEGSLWLCAYLIYVFLIKRHSLSGTIGFIVTSIITGLVLTFGVRALL